MGTIQLNSNIFDLDHFILRYSIILIPNVSELKQYIDYSTGVDVRRIKIKLSITENGVIIHSKIYKISSNDSFMYINPKIGEKTLNVVYYYYDEQVFFNTNFYIVNNIYPVFHQNFHTIVYEPCSEPENFEMYEPYIIEIYNNIVDYPLNITYFRFRDSNNNIIENSERIYIFNSLLSTNTIQYNDNELGIENYYTQIIDFQKFYHQTNLEFIQNIFKDYTGDDTGKIEKLALFLKNYLKDFSTKMEIKY